MEIGLKFSQISDFGYFLGSNSRQSDFLQQKQDVNGIQNMSEVYLIGIIFIK